MKPKSACSVLCKVKEGEKIVALSPFFIAILRIFDVPRPRERKEAATNVSGPGVIKLGLVCEAISNRSTYSSK